MIIALQFHFINYQNKIQIQFVCFNKNLICPITRPDGKLKLQIFALYDNY